MGALQNWKKKKKKKKKIQQEEVEELDDRCWQELQERHEGAGVGRTMLEIGIGEVKEVVHGEIFTEDIVIGWSTKSPLQVQVVAGK